MGRISPLTSTADIQGNGVTATKPFGKKNGQRATWPNESGRRNAGASRGQEWTKGLVEM